MIVIDKCPKSNGVWLDVGELERLTSDIGAEVMIAMNPYHCCGSASSAPVHALPCRSIVVILGKLFFG